MIKRRNTMATKKATLKKGQKIENVKTLKYTPLGR